MLKLDLLALRKALLEACNWILAQISLVQTNTINIVLTANPITVITKFTPPDIISLHWFFPPIQDSNSSSVPPKPSIFYSKNKHSIPLFHSTKKKKKKTLVDYPFTLTPYLSFPLFYPSRFYLYCIYISYTIIPYASLHV